MQPPRKVGLNPLDKWDSAARHVGHGMTVKAYDISASVLLDDQLDEGPIYSLADIVLSALSRAPGSFDVLDFGDDSTDKVLQRALGNYLPSALERCRVIMHQRVRT